MKQLIRGASFILTVVVAAACSDESPVQPKTQQPTPPQVKSVVAAFKCTGSVATRQVSCSPLDEGALSSIGELRFSVIIGGQNRNVRVSSSGASYDAGTSNFTFNTTVQNLMSQAMGSGDGVTASEGGIKLFLPNGVTITSGSGTAFVNSDGMATFTAPWQSFYEYAGVSGPDAMLSPGETSGARTWSFTLPPNVTFSFIVLISTDLKYPQHSAPLFERYVAMGGSNAAGFRSAGIVDSSQADAYPAQLALRAGVVFRVPFLMPPGCPPPITSFVAFPNPAVTCVVEVPPPLPGDGRNVSLPASRVADGLASTPGYRVLLLGPTAPTQVAVMTSVSPTFVTLGAGDEDVFIPALLGTIFGPPGSELPPPGAFFVSYDALVNAIANSGSLQGAALISVLNPLTYLPAIQPGSFFFLARNAATGQFNGKPVNNNCSPVTPLGQPNPLSTNLVSFAIVGSASVPEINCDPAAYGGAYVLDPSEQAIIHSYVNEVNSMIQSFAVARGWVYVDANAVFASALTTKVSGRYPELRKCQDLPFAVTAAQFQAAVLNSCPVTGATSTFPIGGTMFSQDGVTFSKAGQNRLAIALATAINARYGTSINTSP